MTKLANFVTGFTNNYYSIFVDITNGPNAL